MGWLTEVKVKHIITYYSNVPSFIYKDALRASPP